MKNISRNIGLYVIALTAISVGATYALTQYTTLQSFENSPSVSGAFMTGHVEAIVRDEGGNVIAYRQADNDITQSGLTVLAKQVFLPCDDVLSAVACDGSPGVNNHTNTTAPGLRFGYMNIGNSSANLAGDNTGLDCSLFSAGSCGPVGSHADRPLCGAEFDQVWTSRPYLVNPPGPTGSAQQNVTVVATFDGADCFSRNIQEAGLWNNSTRRARA